MTLELNSPNLDILKFLISESEGAAYTKITIFGAIFIMLALILGVVIDITRHALYDFISSLKRVFIKREKNDEESHFDKLIKILTIENKMEVHCFLHDQIYCFAEFTWNISIPLLVFHQTLAKYLKIKFRIDTYWRIFGFSFSWVSMLFFISSLIMFAYAFMISKKYLRAIDIIHDSAKKESTIVSGGNEGRS
jgi:hypothetical protein